MSKLFIEKITELIGSTHVLLEEKPTNKQWVSLDYAHCWVKVQDNTFLGNTLEIYKNTTYDSLAVLHNGKLYFTQDHYILNKDFVIYDAEYYGMDNYGAFLILGQPTKVMKSLDRIKQALHVSNLSQQ